ncbi:MAG: DUF1837 domain-containing protein [Candidatus Thiodiazotropha weberae]|nr:DUF1837 domain-containing protein [Candidatus Thiodiazotropha lotti]MCG8011165.1 DUF1837 domain-containing protein [Candidatus Thiodiazotropha lotti]MCW4210627.1 DUF1837 domain-containing protein [Candidatus Thiodiazotropha lotti]MCW4216650.1 DUF1837 domain-containing protein [Candidatus Thiodiazotropha lotti]
MTLAYLSCLERTDTLATFEGIEVPVWTLSLSDDEVTLSQWATHFRNHYCLDSELDTLRAGTGLSRKDFLTNLVFPDRSEAPGPAIRAGDFAEVLVSDYLEYFSGYWVPRDKYSEKAVRNESVKGADVVGFHLTDGNAESNNPEDVFIAFEVKAKLRANTYEGTLQDAVNHSEKDSLRKALTLNAAKRRLIRQGRDNEALLVQRFQNPTDHPYSYRSGAAAVISDESYDSEKIALETDVSEHSNANQLDLLVIHGADLMDLVTALFDRAADEA